MFGYWRKAYRRCRYRRFENHCNRAGHIEAKDLIPFLKKYIAAEPVELILVGMPLNLDGSSTHATPLVEAKIAEIRKSFPSIPVDTLDERFTSRMAKQAMLQMGLKKKERRDKKLVDEIAATMMLQEYLQSLNS